jgi:hypothetical protein
MLTPTGNRRQLGRLIHTTNCVRLVRMLLLLLGSAFRVCLEALGPTLWLPRVGTEVGH